MEETVKNDYADICSYLLFLQSYFLGVGGENFLFTHFFLSLVATTLIKLTASSVFLGEKKNMLIFTYCTLPAFLYFWS
jgi:hypothetical protein